MDGCKACRLEGFSVGCIVGWKKALKVGCRYGCTVVCDEYCVDGAGFEAGRSPGCWNDLILGSAVGNSNG